MNLLIIIIILTLLFTYYYVEVNIKPTLTRVCEMRAKIIATQIINKVVRDELNKDSMKDQILIPSYDRDGRVNMVRTDTYVMNNISNNIARSVQEEIVNLKNQTFSIPLFTALDNQIFANKGPDLNFTILHEGSVLVDFITDFEQSGINQTRYKIYITVDLDIGVISPIITGNTNVNNNLLIAEIVIIGDVPESYMHLPSLRYKE
ncbi:MAG: sporulation protein YunB [Tissierellia bacterium]|nr:sporulation protein YunB [Tissierellia bacterium]